MNKEKLASILSNWNLGEIISTIILPKDPRG